jgi:hypothetical protein
MGGIVGHFDRLVFVLEAIERCDWTEGLLLGDDHVGRYIAS